MHVKNAIISAAAFLTIGIGGLALIAQPAAARVVCNSYGDCWHTETRYDYDRYDNNQHAQWHNDDWYFHQRWNDDHEHHYRDYHEGRGYYKDGVWITF